LGHPETYAAMSVAGGSTDAAIDQMRYFLSRSQPADVAAQYQYHLCVLLAARPEGRNSSALSSPQLPASQHNNTDLARQQLAQCTAEVQSIGQRFQSAEATIPRDDVVKRSEAIMWFTRQSIDAIGRLCAGQYQSDVQIFKDLHDNTQTTCSAVSTSKCEARLPS
jgi:hypothetical protein